MIHVIAIITAKPGKRDEVLAAFPRQHAGRPRRAGLHRIRPGDRRRRRSRRQIRGRYLCRDREMGEPRPSEGACRLAAHGRPTPPRRATSSPTARSTSSRPPRNLPIRVTGVRTGCRISSPAFLYPVMLNPDVQDRLAGEFAVDQAAGDRADLAPWRLDRDLRPQLLGRDQLGEQRAGRCRRARRSSARGTA